MKNIIFSKTIAVSLTLIFVFGLIPSMGFAQTNPSPSPLGEIRGFNKFVFDSHFSRADRELNPDRWLAEAKLGVTQAIYAWELIACGLYENPMVFEEAKHQVEKWGNEELEARFSQWLIGRFFGEAAEKVLTEFSAMFSDTQKNYSWHLDSEGNIIFDNKTGDPLVIRPGEDGREFSQDLSKWRGEAESLIKTNSDSFDSAMLSLYPELLSFIPEELRETMGAVIHESVTAVSGVIKREFENIAAREERIFTSRRTRDIWSLRKKSDDEAARIFTERLIAETEEACTRGIEEIATRIEEASAGTGDLAILGEEWLKLYKEQFDRGLKAWEEAEERFFIRRIEWEQDSFKLFSEGEEIWLAAFNQFEGERQRWELKVKDLFQSGESLFKGISENFEKSIEEAKKEFELNMAMRIGAGTAKVKALIDMYLVCASAAITARENIQFWQSQCDNGGKDPAESDFLDWLFEERMELWKKAESSYINSADYITSLSKLNQLKTTMDNTKNNPLFKGTAEKNYYDYLEVFNNTHTILFQIQDVIAGKMTMAEEIAFAEEIKNSYFLNFRNFESLLEMRKSYEMYVSYMEKAVDTRDRILADYAELIGTGALKDILASDASSEDFYLDEYQIALIRAKALVQYWERKSAIAQAVMIYAGELDAGRMTEAESIRIWEDAKSSYNAYLAIYESELKTLNAIGEDIHEQQAILDDLAKKMMEAEEKLNRLNNDYSALIAASITNIESSASQNLNAKYNSLVIEYKNLQYAGNNAVYKTVLEYGMKWGISEQREAAEESLDMLINGDGAGMLSLAELQNNVLEGLDSEINLRIRLAAIDLFADALEEQLRPLDSTYSGADWYLKAKEIVLSEEEKAALYGEKLGAQLVADYTNSSRILFEKRLEFELEALLDFLTENPEPEKDAELEDDPESDSLEYALLESNLIGRETAEKIYGILLSLKERLESGEGYLAEDDEENEIINFFISGGSYFTDLENYFSVYLDEYLFCLGLLNLYNEYASISFFIQEEIWQNARNSLETLFAGYSLELTEAFVPSPQSIIEAIFERPGDFVQNAAQFLLEFDKCFVTIPQWLDTEINNWKMFIIEYIAANALYAGIQPLKNLETLALEQIEINVRIRELQKYVDSLKFIGKSEEEFINNTYENINNGGILLYYMDQITSLWETFNNKLIAGENEKHWRQFLVSEHLGNFDPALTMALTWTEGVLADTLYSADYSTNRLNDAFTLFSQKDLFITDEDADMFYDLYSAEASRIDYRFYSLNFQYNEIARLGRTYEISRMSMEQAKAQSEIQYEALIAQEDVFNALRSEYLLEAENFLSIGNQYDEQYANLKKAYDDTDQKRFEYEKQDAIRRWASTAYLNADNIDPYDSKNKLIKAQTVFTVLSNLYSGENSRSYDNPQYDALYSAYEQSFSRKIKILAVFESVFSENERESINNEKIFSNYQNALNSLGYAEQDYSDYISSDSKSGWTIKDIITVNNGQLAFSRNNSMTLTGIDASQANDLENYFHSTVTPDNERFEISLFEESLRGLSQRMAGYFTDSKKFRQWSLARDYLLLSLISANGELNFLKNYYSGLGEAKKGGSLGSTSVQKGISIFSDNMIDIYQLFTNPLSMPDHIIERLVRECRKAWGDLTENERADLEFYVVLTLSGSTNMDNYFAGFSRVFTLDIYNYAYKYVNQKYSYARDEASKWYNFGAYDGMRNINQSARKRVDSAVSRMKDIVQGWNYGLRENIDSIQYYADEYSKSCEKLAAINGDGTSGQSIGWYEINLSLSTTGKVKDEDIAALKTYWKKMQEESTRSFGSVSDALAGLLGWAKSAEDNSKEKLKERWLTDKKNSQNDEYDFQKTEEAFIAGTVGIEALKSAAEKAYGNNAAVWKNHIDKMHTVLINDLSLYLNIQNNFFTEFSILGDEIASLTVKMIEGRYSAEFAVREIEWYQTGLDISEKYLEWRNSAAHILENGRADWNAGVQKMEEAYRQWNINFQNEYNRVSAEWAEAYLTGLEDKEKWLEQAAAAVYEASTESFLSLVGTEGERLSRFIDTREPFGIRDAVPEAETLMAGLLQASGIINMANAFGSLNNIAGVASPLVRRGMGGISTWDSALVKTAASDLARKNSAEIANSETRKLARNARLSAEEAIKQLTDNVDLANKSFQNNMDNNFILSGLWRKKGNNYVKDIIKGSTLFEPIITETVTVTGYKNFTMEPISLQTNIDENYLAGFDSIVIIRLIDDVFEEVKIITEDIFGIGETSIKIKTKDSEEREQSPGKFGAHIGYNPAVKQGKDMGSTRRSIFYDEGAGEIGRLLTEYIYWKVIDTTGSAELAMAPWDKRMWDDQNSSFKAPTLRSTGQFIGAIAATVVTAAATGGLSIAGMVGVIGISSASDLLFGTLDVTLGYKNFEDVAFEVGKNLVINSVSTLSSGLFNGISGVSNNIISQGITSTAMSAANGTVNKIMTQTLMTGVQSFTTGLVTSAVSGITYNSREGWGYSGEIVQAGVKGMLTSTATSMASTFTASSLQAVNTGFMKEKLEGFNSLNKDDLSKLNNFAGSLAGQGISYAMGNDFTLNLLNAGLFTGGKINSGLLELHLGREGSPTMNIGTGGANISIDNLYASLKGVMVWNVNSRINSYTKDNAFDAKIALRAQYGYGDDGQKGQLWDILKGNTEIKTDADGNFRAETAIIDGKRVIYLTGYQSDMSMEEQMRLAVILGHEAYRDGYKTGEMDGSGNFVTSERGFAELKEASIARLAMGDRISQEYLWFYDVNMDFGLENAFLNEARISGDHSMFDDYLLITYDNEKDYFFQWASTGGEYQNDPRNRDIPLFNAKTKERVDEINEERLREAFERHKASLTEEQRDDPGLWDGFIEKKELQKEAGYVKLDFYSIYMVGCRFMSTKYGLEAITGRQFDTHWLNNYIKENNLYDNEAELSSGKMAKIMTDLSDGRFNVTFDTANSNLPSVEQLYKLSQSPYMYLANLKVDNSYGGSHFVMVSGIDFTFDEAGNVKDISAVRVANPWNSSNNLGKQSYTPGEIQRWDIFKVASTGTANHAIPSYSTNTAQMGLEMYYRFGPR